MTASNEVAAANRWGQQWNEGGHLMPLTNSNETRTEVPHADGLTRHSLQKVKIKFHFV